LFAPVDETGKIDVESLHRLVKLYQGNGVSAIVVPVVASEVKKPSLFERAWIVTETISAAQKTPMIGGILGDNGDSAARLAESAMKTGCCAVMYRAPDKVVDNAPKVFEYFGMIASAGMESLIVQNFPFWAGDST